MRINKKQSGFTMIELVVVIVILGILAATALPRFIDLSDEAETAALEGVAGAMGSAMSVNAAGCAAGDGGCQTVAACGDVGLVLQGGVPAGYTVAGTLPACTVADNDTPGTTVAFTGIAAAP